MTHRGMQVSEEQSSEVKVLLHSRLVLCTEVGLSDATVIGLWSFQSRLLEVHVGD